MNFRVILLLVLLSVLAPAGAGLAQRSQQPPKPETARFGNPTSIARAYQDYLYGVIKQISSEEMVLEKTKFGIDQTLRLERKTKYIHDGKPSSLDRLKVGEQVWVEVKTEKKTGEMIARKVLTGVALAGGP